MTPEGWALVTAVAVAIVGGGASVRGAMIAKQTQREASKDSPYDAISEHVVRLEQRIEKQDRRIDQLETELRSEREKSAHQAAAFRTRIQILLRHIAALDEYAEMLVDLIRLHVTTVTTLPRKPDLPTDVADEL